jgi:protein disulfide-isomerase
MIKKLLILLFFLGTFLTHAHTLVGKTTMTDAVATGMEQKKPLLIYFTIDGAPQKIQTEIFNTPDFAVWSRENVILVKLDLSDPKISDAEREQNVKLKSAFGVDELPEVCFTIGSVRKEKTTFNLLGKLPYRPGGAIPWLKQSNLILNPE